MISQDQDYWPKASKDDPQPADVP